MGVRLTDEEAWTFLQRGHTGVLTTLRRDGWPVSLPVWFVVLDRAIYVRAPARTRKVDRVRHDDRVSFCVEQGRAWAELTAVVVTGRAALVEDDATSATVGAAWDDKYAGYGVPMERVPDATRQYYEGDRAVIAIRSCAELITWDNAKLRLR